jgi:hypothetical protein
VINLRQSRHAEDGRVRVSARHTAPARALMLAPLYEDVIVDPQRQTSTPDESFVIFSPVTETVLSLGFLARHNSRLPALPPP